MCNCNAPAVTCSCSFPPPFCIIEPWRETIVPTLTHISGRGTPGALVRVIVDTMYPELSAIVDDCGWWHIDVPFAISDGPHLISSVQQCGCINDYFELPFVQSPIQPFQPITPIASPCYQV